MRNGLYSVHVRLGDGRVGKGSGVLVCRDGSLMGGDAYLYYAGRYEIRGGTILGEVVIDQHTPSADPLPIFGGRQLAGRQVGIGFTGRETGGRINLDGTAFVGRESMLFRASMMFLAENADALPAPIAKAG